MVDRVKICTYLVWSSKFGCCFSYCSRACRRFQKSGRVRKGWADVLETRQSIKPLKSMVKLFTSFLLFPCQCCLPVTANVHCAACSSQLASTVFAQRMMMFFRCGFCPRRLINNIRVTSPVTLSHLLPVMQCVHQICFAHLCLPEGE